MEIIKSSADISAIFNEGRRIGTADITIILLRKKKQHGQAGRAAFVAAKRLGNSVWRNRAKRRMRSVYRETSQFFSDCDVVFMAKRSVNEAPYSRLVENVAKVMKKKR